MFSWNATPAAVHRGRCIDVTLRQGLQTLKNNKSTRLGLRLRAFVSFLVFEHPDETLMFWNMHVNVANTAPINHCRRILYSELRIKIYLIHNLVYELISSGIEWKIENAWNVNEYSIQVNWHPLCGCISLFWNLMLF